VLIFGEPRFIAARYQRVVDATIQFTLLSVNDDLQPEDPRSFRRDELTRTLIL
jgi:hypothetical protein